MPLCHIGTPIDLRRIFKVHLDDCAEWEHCPPDFDWGKTDLTGKFSNRRASSKLEPLLVQERIRPPEPLLVNIFGMACNSSPG
jgi:hypothetical protein